MKENKILCIISARGGSKGIKGKNLKEILGKPLLGYAIENAKHSQKINRIIVSTDSPEIAVVAREYGADTPFMRPKEFSDDHVPLLAVTQHAMKTMDREGYKADVIVQLSPTCPFLSGHLIDQGIEKLLETKCDSVVSLKRIEHEHPYRAKEIYEEDKFRAFIKNIDVESFQQRQDLPELFCTSGALYIRKREILEQWNGRDFCFGNISRAIILNDTEAINIDRPIDLDFARFLFEAAAKEDLKVKI